MDGALPAPERARMWIDGDTAEARIAGLAAEGRPALASALASLRTSGFAILPGAVSAAAIDAYLATFGEELGKQNILVSYGRDILPIAGQDVRKPLLKILDTHARVVSAVSLIFAEPLRALLETIFEEPALAFQGLHFEVGSTQALHQDTAYVVLDKPYRMLAAWIALEDIEAGSGPLAFYPGSHRFEEFLYEGGRKYWNPSIDGHAIHDRHLASLHEHARDRGIDQTLFLARRGDVFVWHADLVHGGSPITDPASTRRSLVVHYCPVSSTPHYFTFVDENRRRKIPVPGGHVVSMYYDLPETL